MPPLPGICSESDRFGVAVAGWIGDYDVGQLHAGWYHNFAISAIPPRPAQMWYAQTIRISDEGPYADKACSTCPEWNTLKLVVQANPGSLWLIGNEPDRQDLVYASRYAELYHDFYAFLKAEDPTCLVGIGGVVQATPIRLQYLDQVLEAYQARYGQAMPVDVWNVHHYLLREADDWGGGIPPGTDTGLAIKYKIEEHDMLEPHLTDPEKVGWKGHLVEMRRWMQSRGYQDRPLVITEYGILMPELYGYDYTRVRNFMLATFDWMRTATDPEIGYPADGNRLLQAWAWYSLNDPSFEGFDSWSHLFDPDSQSIMQLGQEYAAYTAALTDPYPGVVDLQPVAVWHTEPESQEDGSVAMTVMAQIHNAGGATAHNVLVRFERDDSPAGEVTLGNIDAGHSKQTSITWQDLKRGELHEVTVEAQPDGQDVECDPYNNRLSVQMLVTDIQYYLPTVVKNW